MDFSIEGFSPSDLSTHDETNCETLTLKRAATSIHLFFRFVYLYTMAIKLKHKDTFSTYFITFTCAEWIPLFELTGSCDLVYNWFSVLKTKMNAAVVAYVIMPNHLHSILHFSKEGFDLDNRIR